MYRVCVCLNSYNKPRGSHLHDTDGEAGAQQGLNASCNFGFKSRLIRTNGPSPCPIFNYLILSCVSSSIQKRGQADLALTWIWPRYYVFAFFCFFVLVWFFQPTVYIKVQFVANIKKLISWFFMKTGIFLKTHKMCQCWACTSLCGQRPLMLDAKAIMSLDGLPIFPLWLTYRGQGLSAIYTHLPVFFKFTSLSIIAKRTRDEPQGTAPSPVQAQQLCATK